MQGNLSRLAGILNGVLPLLTSDRASSSSNTWTDGASVDAHAYSGYVYDFYFKRFNRRGLDGNNLRILSFVHPLNRQDCIATFSQNASVCVNAGYYGGGVMIYGDGLPPEYTLGGQHYNYFSGALDVVAHELTHGVTDFTSQLQYRNESGALNESFSDMMGVAAEFFHQPIGNGLMQADYLLGEDIATPGGNRSMSNPGAYGQPDHYSRRLVTATPSASNDNGYVHSNSGISNHVFYLAIEGGTNRTSGLSVQGVGAGNRDQIEKVMYRAFTQLLPSNASFSLARAATIQAATDLYGSTSAAVRALTQAWTAVGVN